MPTTAISDWGTATWTGFAAGLAGFYSFIPNLISAALILLIGWAIASALYAVTDRLLDAVHFDSLMSRVGVNSAIARSGVRIDPSNLVATLVKWVVLLVAIMMAADALNLTAVTVGISSILGYIPNVIAAVIILTLGMLLANFVSTLVRGAASSAGMRMSDLLADLSYWAITVFAALGAIGQLNIAPQLVQTLYTAVIAAVALAGALAFGLGLRDQAKDVVAGRTLMEVLHEGDELEAEDVRGRVERIGVTNTIVRTENGTVAVPNHRLASTALKVTSGLAMAGGGGGETIAKPPFEQTRQAYTEHPWRAEPDELPPI